MKRGTALVVGKSVVCFKKKNRRKMRFIEQLSQQYDAVNLSQQFLLVKGGEKKEERRREKEERRKKKKGERRKDNKSTDSNITEGEKIRQRQLCGKPSAFRNA